MSERGAASTGLGVDISGNPVIDPTKNVLYTLDRESQRQDELREAESRFQNYAREFEARFSAAISGAEKERIDQLADLRAQYEERIAATLNVSIEARSAVLSGQLSQGQAAVEKRLFELEQFRLTATLSQSGSSRQSMGRSEVVAWFVSGVLLLTTIGTCVAAFLVHH
jgi:hypothetical protein